MKHQSLFSSLSVLRGGRVVKTARGVVSLAPLMAGVLCAGGTMAQEACIEPEGGPAGSEICDLGVLSGTTDSVANGVNADGTVVVGWSDTIDGWRAFRWSAGHSMESLGLLSGGRYASWANDVNVDGTVVVGESSSTYGVRAFRWVEGSGMESLGALSTYSSSGANGVNADGTVVVGWSDSYQGQRALRWVEGSGMENLGMLSGGNFSWANDVNADGTIVVGVSDSADGERAFRWVEGGSMDSLGVLSGGNESWANGVNADGAVVVGWSDSADGTRAFRWVEGSGMESLGVLNGGDYSNAYAVSADGAVVVGESTSADGWRAFRWVEGSGMESLGVLSGGISSEANGVNADGTVVVGESGSADGRRAFIWRAATETDDPDDGTGGTMEDLANLTASIPVVGRDTALAFATQQGGLTQLMGMRGLAGGAQVRVSSKGTGALAGLTSGGGNYFATRLAVERTSGDAINYGSRSSALAALSYGHALSDEVTLGLALDAQDDSLHNNAFDMDSGFGAALWGIYSQGGMARTGWQVAGALGYSRADGTVTRGRLLTDVIEATGEATMSTRAVEAQIGYGFDTAQGWKLTPSVGLAHYETRRSAYSESGAAFNARYEAEEVGRTTLTLALDGERAVSAAGTVLFGLGVERDLSADTARLKGTSDLPSLATFDIASDEDRNRTRPFASLGYRHTLADGAQLSANAQVSRAAFGDKPSLGLGLGYEMRF